MQWKIEVTVLVKRATEHRTSLHGSFIEKQYRVLGIQARLFAWLRDSYTQYRMPSAILRNLLWTDSKIQFV